jgi:hypothetical protein
MVEHEASSYGGSEPSPVGLIESVVFYDPLLQNLGFCDGRSIARPVLGAVGYHRPIKSVLKPQYTRLQPQDPRYDSNSSAPNQTGTCGHHWGTSASVERCTIGPVERHCPTVHPNPSIDKPGQRRKLGR